MPVPVHRGEALVTWAMQAIALPHSPSEPHCCTPLPKHRVELTTHVANALHAKGHVRVVCQVPVASHACELVPEHCIAPGTHEPAQVPLPVHAYGHVEVVAHWRDVLHVWTFFAEHWIEPDAQLPVHTPLEHTAGHRFVFCHVPIESQV
jgi:hypothetical protein